MSDLDDLARFNDEEWAGKPYTIELRGGVADGQRFSLHELPWMWQVPEPLSLEFHTHVDTYPTASFRTIDYWRTDRVTDDGAHVYEAPQRAKLT